MEITFAKDVEGCIYFIFCTYFLPNEVWFYIKMWLYLRQHGKENAIDNLVPVFLFVPACLL